MLVEICTNEMKRTAWPVCSHEHILQEFKTGSQ